jgi:hypothetical protein
MPKPDTGLYFRGDDSPTVEQAIPISLLEQIRTIEHPEDMQKSTENLVAKLKTAFKTETEDAHQLTSEASDKYKQAIYLLESIAYDYDIEESAPGTIRKIKEAGTLMTDASFLMRGVQNNQLRNNCEYIHLLHEAAMKFPVLKAGEVVWRGKNKGVVVGVKGQEAIVDWEATDNEPAQREPILQEYALSAKEKQELDKKTLKKQNEKAS